MSDSLFDSAIADDEFSDPPPAVSNTTSDFDDFIKVGAKIYEGKTSRKMPHPVTGDLTSFTRASRFAQTLADRYILEKWLSAMAVIGLTFNKGLHARSHALGRPLESMELREQGWWMPWHKIAEKCIDYADAHTGAHLGTAFHDYAYNLDHGISTLDDVLDEWRPHAEAYLRIHQEMGMVTVPEYLERLVVNLKIGNKNLIPNDPYYKGKGYNLCGRIDALRRLSDGSLIVDDTKTGKQAPKGSDEIAMQLAIYANSEWIWNSVTETYEPMPKEVRKDIATITWVPINDPANAQIIPIDIKWGWEAVKHAAWVREYRNAGTRKYNGLKLAISKLLPE